MQNAFTRYEKKYLITKEQALRLRSTLSQHMVQDQYGEYLVQNLYYDTENWDIVRTSIEKPIYKEKMRLRCYGNATDESKYYLELKKKYKGVVYKRRISIPSQSLAGKTIRSVVSEAPSQISRELDFYIQRHEVAERIYIANQRVALAGIADEGLRVTFDTDVRFRLNDLNFSNSTAGQRILTDGKILMEVKALGGMPLWMANALSENRVFPTSFSKFGICYTDYIFKMTCKESEEKICA